MGKSVLIGKPTVTNQQINSVIVDRLVAEPAFVYYSLLGRREEIFNLGAGGSRTPILNKRDFEKLKISLPPIEEQRRIANVLSALDDKIELNRQMNETLEAMARALFQSWFVDFDPVRARTEGRDPGLPPHLVDLFPNSFVDSALGEIPQGWEVERMSNLTSKIGSGATPRGGQEVYVEQGTSLIRSQNVYDSRFVWSVLARIMDEAARKLSSVSVQSGDILLNIRGASILRTCVVEPSVLPARVNQHVAIVRAEVGVPPHFLHEHLLRPLTKAYLLGMDAGASRQAITKGHIESVLIPLPPMALLGQFQGATDPLFERMQINVSESLTLASLRDTLLPKLISGELRVRDAERAVECAV